MPEDLVLTWLIGLCEGVRSLHERGIVHRDLKPGNVFMGQGVVKLGDYGLSKFISASRRSGHTGSIGTVHYMAPEVAQGRYGKEIDLYSIGVMLFEMLTGRLPFDGETAGEILMKHLTATPDLSMLPEPYRSVIGRLLEKDPERRYPHLDAMMADLGITRDSIPRLTQPSVPVLQTVEPTVDWRIPKRQIAPEQPAARGWLLVLLALVGAGFMAGWFALLGGEVLGLREATAVFAVGGGILSFFIFLGVLQVIVRQRGALIERLMGQNAWVDRLPWFGRLFLTLATSVGSAMIIGGLLAETGALGGVCVLVAIVSGSVVFVGCLAFFFGRRPSLAEQALGRRRDSRSPRSFALVVRLLALSAGVGLLVGGFLGGMMQREGAIGVFIGIAAGLLTLVIGGIWWQARLFTGLTVAALSSVAIGLFVGGIFSLMFRREEPAALAAVGCGLVAFAMVMVLWQRFLLPQLDSARSHAQGYLSRMFGPRLERARV
jgi:hypothetical protein